MQRVESSVNLDAFEDPCPYFMSPDLASARLTQTLLAMHFNGQPLSVDHGALCGDWPNVNITATTESNVQGDL